jgi:hypothetical protein
MQTPSLTLYAVRNASGLWFRSWGSRDTNWVASPAEAKLYAKLPQARARVTFFASRYPKAPLLEIIALTLTASEVLPEGQRVAKVIERKRTEKERRAEREAKERLEIARLDYAAAKARLEALAKDTP